MKRRIAVGLNFIARALSRLARFVNTQAKKFT